VAIVGLSQPNRFGGKVYLNLRHFGYPGQIFGVNPRYPSLYEQPCYPSLSALPTRPDCAILAVPNERLPEALREAASLGIRAAVIPGSAFGVQDQLTEIARAHGLVLCGPNCMGFHAFAQKLVVSGYPIAPGTPAGNVAFITHSGSVFDALWQNTRGVHFNYLISSGNEIVTTLADYVRFAVAQDSTRVIGLFLETVRDPQNFLGALQAAQEREIPIVALKVGRTESGARLALAHSGALAGADAAYDAVFQHYGVSRVRSLDEMLDTLELFASGLRPPTRFIASLHDSGGERGLLADLAEAEGVAFAAINSATQAKLAATLDPGLAPINPLDAWGTGNEAERIYRDCLLALDADPAVGLNVLAVDLYPSELEDSTYVNVALALQPQLTKPLVFLSNLAASLGPVQAARLRAAGLPVLMGTENGVRAIRHLLAYSEKRRSMETSRYPAETRLPGLPLFAVAWASTPLDEFTSGELLRAYGIPVAERALAQTLAETLNAAVRLGYPVALKTAMGVAHKNDAGGVCLNLSEADSLATAYEDFATRFGPRVLVQKMVPAGVELIVGLVNDPQFGQMLALGLGGIFVEVLNDSRLICLPTTRAEVQSALLSLRGAALFHGPRGRPAMDMEAVVDVALRLSALAQDLGEQLEALDINPLMALPQGCVAVDALVIPKGLHTQAERSQVTKNLVSS
jgi:acyl-CoA synthetase (NDP forming)